MSLVDVVSYILHWRGPSTSSALYEEVMKLGVRGLELTDFECFLKGAELFAGPSEEDGHWQFRAAGPAVEQCGSDDLVASKGRDDFLTEEVRDEPSGAMPDPDAMRTGACAEHGARAESPIPGQDASPRGLLLYDWQYEALEAWKAAGRRGVVEAVTGTGKTRVGIAATLEELSCGGKVLVVVPTIDLLVQWRNRLRLYVDHRRIGLLGDGHRDTLIGHDVLVAVVNSVRVQQLPLRQSGGLLIADECHRYGSQYNQEALDARFDKRLGLSATYARLDDGHLGFLDPYFGGTCFRIGYERAIADRVVAPFKVALIGTQFSADERDAYDDADQRARDAKRKLIAAVETPADSFGEFIKEVNAIADDDSHWAMPVARTYLKVFNERRAILADTSAKRSALQALLPAIGAAQRTLVFTQTVNGAEDIAYALRKGGIAAAAIHSRLDQEDRRSVLARFARGELKAVIAPQVLDEGIDVPEADLAILAAASKTKRQMIQRMGRVLRRKADGRMARFAVLYVEGTSEDPASGAHEAFLEEITKVAEDIRSFGVADGLNSGNEYLSEWELAHIRSAPNQRPFRLDSPSAGSSIPPVSPSTDTLSQTGPSSAPAPMQVGDNVAMARTAQGNPSTLPLDDLGIITVNCWFCGERVVLGTTGADRWVMFDERTTSRLHECEGHRVPLHEIPTNALPRRVWARVMQAQSKGVRIRSYGEYARALITPRDRRGASSGKVKPPVKETSRERFDTPLSVEQWSDASAPRTWDECSSCGVRIVVQGGVDQCARCLTAN
jgi:RNA polymerase primary sigma factor